MNAIILSGGLGTQSSEETTSKLKPMVEIGGKPIEKNTDFLESNFLAWYISWFQF